MRAKPLVRRRIEALLSKAADDGCTAEEAASARTKACELASKFGFARDEFRWPVATGDNVEAEQPADKPKAVQEPPQRARGRGIGELARELIVTHPDWSYQRIADEVNERIDGARTSANSVRWYSNAMRREGIEGTLRARGQ
jgi:hypothetical protein